MQLKNFQKSQPTTRTKQKRTFTRMHPFGLPKGNSARNRMDKQIANAANAKACRNE